ASLCSAALLQDGAFGETCLFCGRLSGCTCAAGSDITLMQTGSRRIFLEGAVVCGGVVLSLLALEAALRGFGYVPYYLDGHAFIPSRNPTMLYELRPGFHGLYAAVPVRINLQGLRGQDSSGGRSTPVIIVGDSIAFGQGVREGETLAEQLTPLLRGRFG